ncbi:MAG: hypothetical protein HGA42_18650, partial [Nostocales cyanobacterium W4_Combined_metabat2_030]|nr:hypothetical protein [Nostocales cyanobacterium W4_Combined_metabat2_030]
MDWKTASSYYETRLTDALNIQRHAVNLANLPQAEVPEKLKQILLQEAQPARRQLERLKKREFRIAVVGLEKAGKSTFVNAWLECDLLPAKGGRCTFTTTQIYSVQNESEQKLEVQAKTEDEFIKLLKELEKAKAQEDINTIQNKYLMEENTALQERLGKSLGDFTHEIKTPVDSSLGNLITDSMRDDTVFHKGCTTVGDHDMDEIDKIREKKLQEMMKGAPAVEWPTGPVEVTDAAVNDFIKNYPL